VSNLLEILRPWARRHGVGAVVPAPFDVVLSPADVVQPDLCLVAAGRAALLASGHLEGAPDLAVEVVSESTRRRDEVTKRHLYERHGVREYWLVDPDAATLTVYHGGPAGFGTPLVHQGEATFESRLPPGLAVSLAEVLRP